MVTGDILIRSMDMLRMRDQIKILSHKDVIKNILLNKVSYPVHVQIELTEICNFRCVFCPWHGGGDLRLDHLDFTGKRSFETNRLMTLIDELEAAGVKAIAMTGAGENILHPDFHAIAARLASSKMEFALTSNFGGRLRDETLVQLLKAKWIRWSVNAGNEVTFNRINRPLNKNAFHIAIDNIRRMVAMRKDETVHIGASFVIGCDNQDSILEAVRLLRDIGVDAVSFRPEVSLSRNDKLLQYDMDVTQALQEAEGYQTERFRVYQNLHRHEDTVKITEADLK